MEKQLEKTEQSKEIRTEYLANGESVSLTAQMVRQTLVHGNGAITNQELTMFMALCKYQHLNPFLNEAYIIKFGSQPAQLITSKEAFMKRAESNPQYDGIKAGIIVLRNGEIVYSNGAFRLKDDEIVGAWAEVYRKDRSEPHRVEISAAEFNKSQSTWKTMPATMIRKTAMVNALREAFPEALGGMYTEDDRNPQDTSVSAPEAVENEQKTAKLAKRFAKRDDQEEPQEEIKEVEPEIIADEEEPEREPEQNDIFETAN